MKLSVSILSALSASYLLISCTSIHYCKEQEGISPLGEIPVFQRDLPVSMPLNKEKLYENNYKLYICEKNYYIYSLFILMII
jgi:hypothetical protein